MAKQIKITKEELERNEVLEFSDHILFWLKAHGSKLVIILAIIFAVYASVIVYNNYQERQFAAASDKLFSAFQDFEKALESEWATPARKTSMDSARTKIAEITAEFGNSAIARNALFLKGNTFYFEGDNLGSSTNTQEAIKLFTEYRDEAVRLGDDFERAAALLALGYAHENLWLLTTQNPAEAKAALVAAVKFYTDIDALGDKAGFLRYEALNAIARIQLVDNKLDEAKDLYLRVFNARHEALEPPPATSSQRQQMLFQLRQIAGQFTAASTARIQLERLGVDVEALEKAAAEAKATKPA